jgi:outer membrane protein TolC
MHPSVYAAENLLFMTLLQLTLMIGAVRDALANAANRYRAGYSPYLVRIDADRNLLATELFLVQTRADRLTAVVSLYQAPVGGWLPAN